MKFSALLFGSALVVLFSCKKDTTPDPPKTSNIHLKTGLLVYLPFDGNMADSSGNGNVTEAIAGAKLDFDEHGYANSAFGGTGNGERIVVTNNGSIKFDTAFTISQNVMIRNWSGQTFSVMVNRSNGTGVSFGIGLGTPGINNFNFTVTTNLATCDKPVDYFNTVVDTSSLILQPESWYNVVGIFHNGTLQIYVNGKLVSTKTGASSTVAVCPQAQFVVGGWWDADPQSINGKLDEVRLYNRVLNADEIAELSKDFQND
ncbi:LamG domain-containing protein [Flavitalea flava]